MCALIVIQTQLSKHLVINASVNVRMVMKHPKMFVRWTKNRSVFTIQLSKLRVISNARLVSIWIRKVKIASIALFHAYLVQIHKLAQAVQLVFTLLKIVNVSHVILNTIKHLLCNLETWVSVLKSVGKGQTMGKFIAMMEIR